MPGKILLARISAAHGIKGEVKLQVFASDLANLTRRGALETADGRRVEISRLKPATNHFIAALKGVADRNQAESLRGAELFIDRGKLPDAGAGETYAHDLIGLEVRLGGGARLGSIVNVQNFGAGDLLEIQPEGLADTVFIPYTDEYVTAADAGVITVELAPGFLDAE